MWSDGHFNPHRWDYLGFNEYELKHCCFGEDGDQNAAGADPGQGDFTGRGAEEDEGIPDPDDYTLTLNPVAGISNYEYEIIKNNKKRSINVVRSNYLEVIKEDMRELLTYTDSSQYVNSKLKKGSNLRFLSPR